VEAIGIYAHNNKFLDGGYVVGVVVNDRHIFPIQPSNRIFIPTYIRRWESDMGNVGHNIGSVVLDSN